MTQRPVPVEDDNKEVQPKADNQLHKPANHIEETARLAGLARMF